MSATAEAGDFKFGMWLGFAMDCRKIKPAGKGGSGTAIGASEVLGVLLFLFCYD